MHCLQLGILGQLILYDNLLITTFVWEFRTWSILPQVHNSPNTSYFDNLILGYINYGLEVTQAWVEPVAGSKNREKTSNKIVKLKLLNGSGPRP